MGVIILLLLLFNVLVAGLNNDKNNVTKYKGPFKPNISFDQKTSDYDRTIFREGSLHTADCIVMGDDSTIITWFIDYVQLRDDIPEFQLQPVVTFRDNDTSSVSQKLDILMTKKWDKCRLTCRAEHAMWPHARYDHKEIHVHPAFSGTLPQHKAYIWPDKINVRAGFGFTVLCQYASPIRSCRISGPEIESEDYSSDPDQIAYGRSNYEGECGAHFTTAPASWSGGNITCSLVVDGGGDEHVKIVEASIVITVLRDEVPEEPMLILSPPRDVYLAGSELVAQCVVSEGIPAAYITWWLDDDQLTSAEQPIIIENEKSKKLTVTQNLSRVLTVADDGRRLVCRAEHPLLQVASSAAVQLTVVPPTSAELEKNLDIDKVIVVPKEVTKLDGESLTFLCQVNHPIDVCRVAVGEYIYNLRPERQLEDGIEYFGSGLRNGQCGAYIKRIEGFMRGNITCFLPPRSGGVTELRGDMQLKIPRAPVLSSLVVDVGNSKVGDTIVATCIAEGASPAPNFTWWIDDEPILAGIEELLITVKPIRNVPSYTQKLSRKLTAADHGRLLKCRIHHEYDFDKEETFKITVLHELTIEPKKISLGVGTDLKIICKATGPIQSCLFEDQQHRRIAVEEFSNIIKIDLKGDVVEEEGSPYKSTFNNGDGFEAGECSLYITNVTLDLSGKLFCHVAMKSDPEYEISASMDLEVTSPLKVHLEVLPYTLAPGLLLQAKCEVDDARPAAEISWWLDDKKIWTDLKEPVITRNKHTGEESVSQYLRYLLTAADSGRRVLSCRADHAVWKQPYTANATLDVQYKPTIEPEEGVARSVGENFTILCSAGYPLEYCRILLGQTSFKLSDQYQDETIAYYGKGLKSGECGAIISSVREEWFGVVRCFVPPPKDGTRELSASMRLVKPDAPNDPEVTVANEFFNNRTYYEGEQVTLLCYVEDAVLPAKLTWLMDESFSAASRIVHEKSRNTLYTGVPLESVYLRLPHTMTADDNGRVVTCRGEHVAWAEPKIVKMKPFVVHYAPKTTSQSHTVSLGDEVVVSVTVRANPLPLVEWHRGGRPLHLQTQGSRVQILEPVAVGNDFYNCTMKILTVSEEDLGVYILKVHNTVGSADATVTLVNQVKKAQKINDLTAVLETLEEAMRKLKEILIDTTAQ